MCQATGRQFIPLAQMLFGEAPFRWDCYLMVHTVRSTIRFGYEPLDGIRYDPYTSARIDISRGRWGLRQFGGFLVVAVIVALFVPTECPVGGGMWGIFGKPLKRAIWNTLGLHAVLTTCSRFSSVWDRPVFLAASFVNRQLPCPHTNSLHGLQLSLMHHRNIWCAKERALGV